MSEPLKPYEHIARAEMLIAAIDAKFDEQGESKAMWGMTPVGLELAQAHLQLAHMKMIGGQRA